MKPAYIFLLIFITVQSYSQNYDKNYFDSPVKIPIRLAGNFGEIRPNHFHSGIDIKVPYAGLPIYAPADGYVSRIRKSADGYGNALYITHPNGLMTVYGHLRNFIKILENYSDSIQYAQNEFEFTNYPTSGKFNFKKGELIAFAGNTGRSYGPHIHFEVREAEKDVPINPCYFNFNITDNIKPKIFNIAAFALSENGTINNTSKKIILKPVKKGNNYFINELVEYSGNLGFAIRANDYMNSVKNSQGIYSLKLYVDDELIYHHQLDKISFEETRYINSFIDFEERQISNLKYQKCYIEPGNKLDIYKFDKNKGIINYIDEQIHQVKIEVSDIYGNMTYVYLKIKGKALNNNKSEKKLWLFDAYQYFEKDDFRAYFKKESLYTNIEQFFNTTSGTGMYNSVIYTLSNYYTPIHEPIHIAIKANKLAKELIPKALIIHIDESGKLNPLDTDFMNDFFIAQTNEFGNFAITVDTIPPNIEEENFTSEKNFTNQDKISFLISDNLSGIRNYNAKIDNNNIIFTYDKKNKRIFYIFDNHIEFNKSHKLTITIFDKKFNKKVYETVFFK
jgi:hypothetical protein